MSYLARLKAKIAETHPPSEPTKPTNAPSVGSVGGQGRHVFQNDMRLTARSAWWNDLSEVQARFDEAAGIREFDCGLSRLDAEAVAADCLLTELQLAGLTSAEARGMLESARNRQRMMRH